MKAIGNIAAMMSAVVLMGALLIAQRDYQNSFGGRDSVQSAATDDSGSIASYSPAYEAVVMK
jgi:hypothetical protein